MLYLAFRAYVFLSDSLLKPICRLSDKPDNNSIFVFAISKPNNVLMPLFTDPNLCETYKYSSFSLACLVDWVLTIFIALNALISFDFLFSDSLSKSLSKFHWEN